MNPAYLSYTPIWDPCAPGVWKLTVGEGDPITPLSAAATQPKVAALEAMVAAPFPLDPADIGVVAKTAKTFLTFPLAESESIYGLGLDFKAVRRNQSVQKLRINAWEGHTGSTHAPVPFYVSSLGYGVLVNSARHLDFYVGTSTRTDSKRPPAIYDRNLEADKWQAVPPSDTIDIHVPSSSVEVLIFAGPTPMDAVRRFNLYCGGGCLPPKWGLGFMSRVATLSTGQDVLDEIAAFADRGFPLDMLGLEPGWHDYSYPCSFEWDATRFPDPAEVATQVEASGVSLNLWFNPYVAAGTPLAADVAPYVGSHLVWNGLVPDYSLDAAREAFAKHLEERVVSLGAGIGGFKIDEVDGGDNFLWPDTALFPSGVDAEVLRQSYSLFVQRLILDLYHRQGRRTLGLARGTNAGSAPMPYVLYSDSYDFDQYLIATCNSGFCGVLWSPEVRWADSTEEWVRRMQMVCLSPLAMLNGYAHSTKPWTFADGADAVRDVMLLRSQLLPYLYTTFARYHFDGTPPIRPMQLVEGFADITRAEGGEFDATFNPYADAQKHVVHDQYMLGDSLLVAPMRPGAKTRTVALPAGKWYDFYSGAFVGESETIEVAAPLDIIPLFVPDGAVIPMIPAHLHAPAPSDSLPLTARHYGERDGHCLLYDDDGVTFGYESGQYGMAKLAASRGANGQWATTVTFEGPPEMLHYSGVTWEFMSTR
ncbi:MAG TPA: TIM-barrel domain-containing protein [Capsulimonadaceae bacterium]|jgi:alpha-D-xyloside xylohydrolase